MIRSGDKNVNVKEIIDKLSGTRYPSNDGVDDYTANEPYVEYPRDEREHNVLESINSDQTKPVDGDDILTRVKKLENAIQ